MFYKLLFISFLICTGLQACQSRQNEDDKQQNEIVQNDSILTEEVELEGYWGLTSYFDSILQHKEIARYRLQKPTWFGILLQIKGDSLFAYGSIVELQPDFNPASDTLAKLDSFAGEYWLFKRKETLELHPIPNEDDPDSTIFIYRKRDDLDFMTQNLDKVHVIGTNVTNYFNEKLFAGNYYLKDTKDTIQFKPNGQILNWKKYDNFSVRNYFGTLHPFQNKDVIFLKKEKEMDYWNWTFEENKLILQRMESDWYKSDTYQLTDEIIELETLVSNDQ